MPLILFKLLTTKSLLSLKASALSFIKSWVPFNASTAAGMGCISALEAEKFLSSKN